jgi:serine phosphatase RsbU (regulator of sigma subunit)
MRRFVNYLDQSKFVLSMNSHFVECSSAGCFATAVVTTFFAPTRTLSVCNAGHPAPLVWRTSTGEWSLLERRNAGQRVANIPLGIMDLDDCEQFGVELDVGDLVLIYTDSLIEARDPSGAMLGTTGLLTLARQVCDPNHPDTMIATLLRAVDEKTGGGLRADDATVLLLRPNGTATTTTWGEFFTAQWKIARSLGRALVGRGPAGLPEMSVVNIGGALVGRLNRRWGRRCGR